VIAGIANAAAWLPLLGFLDHTSPSLMAAQSGVGRCLGIGGRRVVQWKHDGGDLAHLEAALVLPSQSSRIFELPDQFDSSTERRQQQSSSFIRTPRMIFSTATLQTLSLGRSMHSRSRLASSMQCRRSSSGLGLPGYDVGRSIVGSRR
jgi:hypothetical protein